MTEGNVFTLSTILGGYPILGLDGGYISQIWMGGYPIMLMVGGVPHPQSGQGEYPIPGQDEGYPGYPPEYPHQEDGVPPISRVGYYPISRMGYPPHQYDGVLPHPGPRSGQGGTPTGTAWHVLAMRQAVCLLRSRRRTFLLKIILNIPAAVP